MNQLANTAVGLSPDRPPHGTPAAAQTRSCAVCGEFISLAASVCRFCGHNFDEAEVAASIESLRLQEAEATLQAQQESQQRAARAADQLRRRSLRTKKILLQIPGWLLTVVGAFSLVSCVVSFITTGTSEEIGKAIGASLFCLLLFASGLALLWRARKMRRQLKELLE